MALVTGPLSGAAPCAGLPSPAAVLLGRRVLKYQRLPVPDHHPTARRVRGGGGGRLHCGVSELAVVQWSGGHRQRRHLGLNRKAVWLEPLLFNQDTNI